LGKTLSPLTHAIVAQIKQAGGAISFDQWMTMALYDGSHGYYEGSDIFNTPDQKNSGDFVTAADLGPWASLAFADLITWSWQQLGEPASWALVEQGGGSGRLLLSIIKILHLPSPTIYAIERSAQRRQQQQTLYQQHGIAIEQYATLDQLPSLEKAVLISNELPDAFPVRRFVAHDGNIVEHMVAWNGDSFVWKKESQPINSGPDIAAEIRSQWPNDYHSEWNPNLAPWLKQCAQVANKSLLVCVDYGFPQSEYYRPERNDGTLMGHRHHRVVENILAETGKCDITAHVDFTAMLKAANQVGFQGVAFMPQWAWLAQSPSVQQQMTTTAASRDLAAVQAIAQAKRLMLPQGMGETFKLLIASNNVATPTPHYLASFDRLASLSY